MLGEIDEELRQALGLDVVGVHGPGTMFGFKNEGWKPFTMFDGTPVLVPGQFNVTPADDGGWFIYPEGDTSVPPSGWMPKDSYFFDSTRRQEPLDEASLDPGRQLRGVRRRQRRGGAALRPAGAALSRDHELRHLHDAAGHGVWRHRAGARAVDEASQRHPRRGGMVHGHGHATATTC